MESPYDKFILLLKKFEKKNKIQILHRGFSKEYGFQKFNLNPEYNTLKQFGENLFFFGEKSKNFIVEDKSIKFRINDISRDVFERIFNIFLDLSSENILPEFYEKNTNNFNYFVLKNKNEFLNKVEQLGEKCKMFLRNHYFSILHQLDKNDFKDVSLFLSSANEESTANRFALKSGIVINFWKWNNKPINKCNLGDLPYFKGVPFDDENEESILGVIFPHYIYSFECEGKIFINPNIPDIYDEDIYEFLLYTGFEIDQSNFDEKLKKMTSYQSYLENIGNNLVEKN
ncbi:hypothetical protein CGC54_10365 [Capnocytophaga canimorsus]|uniref:Uncharacterized protein n=1 Tax=Capnocytophaga canimorsus TaxID=28188 RepID=A0AAC9Z528_9FLAO|nr:hypothetical protein [Capnocytophaga canimorsus]ATA94705.1 hypothetical protein CGC54_10365 [Capnocytophaga canimorsus]